MNEITNNFLLARDKFMLEIHSSYPGFTYNACGWFAENKGRIVKLKETGVSQYIYQNKLDKAYFKHDMAYGYFKDFHKRTASDKVLCDKAFSIDAVKRSQLETLATLDKFDIKSKNMSNHQLAEDLHKPNVRKSEEPKVYSSFR